MKLKPHLQYAHYVARHKYWVLREGLKLGVPLWQLIIHDWHKMTPAEWFPYVRQFYGEPDQDAFDLAWLRHQNRGKHHWQWWCLALDDGGTRALAMPDRYRREMLADWRGAGRAIHGSDDCLPWYDANRKKMRLHYETRRWVEDQIGWQTWMAFRPSCITVHGVCKNDTDGDGDCWNCARWWKQAAVPMERA